MLFNILVPSYSTAEDKNLIYLNLANNTLPKKTQEFEIKLPSNRSCSLEFGYISIKSKKFVSIMGAGPGIFEDGVVSIDSIYDSYIAKQKPQFAQLVVSCEGLRKFVKKITYVPVSKFKPLSRLIPEPAGSNGSKQNSSSAAGSNSQETSSAGTKKIDATNYGNNLLDFINKFKEGNFISQIDDRTMRDDKVIIKFTDSFFPLLREIFKRNGPATADLILFSDTRFMSCHPSRGYNFLDRYYRPNVIDSWVQDIQWRDQAQPYPSYLVWSSNLGDESNNYYRNLSESNWELTCYLDYSQNFKYSFSLRVTSVNETEKEYSSANRFISLAPSNADPTPLGKCSSPGAKFTVSTYEEYKCSDIEDSTGEPEYWKFGNLFTLYKWRRDFSVNQPACDAFTDLYNEVNSIGTKMVILQNSILFNTPADEAREKRALIEDLRNQQDEAKIRAEKKRAELEAICNFRR